jgi:hypothetical protein
MIPNSSLGSFLQMSPTLLLGPFLQMSPTFSDKKQAKTGRVLHQKHRESLCLCDVRPAGNGRAVCDSTRGAKGPIIYKSSVQIVGILTSREPQ